MGSSNPRCWRGERLHHHVDGVFHVVCAFCVVSDSWLVSSTCCTYILEVLQSGPPGLHHQGQSPAKPSLKWRGSVFCNFGYVNWVLNKRSAKATFVASIIVITILAIAIGCIDGSFHWQKWYIFVLDRWICSPTVAMIRPASEHTEDLGVDTTIALLPRCPLPMIANPTPATVLLAWNYYNALVD